MYIFTKNCGKSAMGISTFVDDLIWMAKSKYGPHEKILKW